MGSDEKLSQVPADCWYRGYRNPPSSRDQYDLSPQYWHVFAARLAFVVVFEVSLPLKKRSLLKDYYSVAVFQDQ
jgi:hypothetical protein